MRLSRSRSLLASAPLAALAALIASASPAFARETPPTADAPSSPLASEQPSSTPRSTAIPTDDPDAPAEAPPPLPPPAPPQPLPRPRLVFPPNQPPTWQRGPVNPHTGLPYECETMANFGEAMVGLGDALDRAFTALGSAIVPQTGVRLSPGASQPWDTALSWPISVPFGPPTSIVVHPQRRCERVPRRDEHRAHRFAIDPGLAFPSRTTAFVRGGYRYVHHAPRAGVGIGGGVGSTVEVFAPEATPRPSLGAEAILHVGECCRAGYVNVLARYDRFFAGPSRDAITLAIGLAFY